MTIDPLPVATLSINALMEATGIAHEGSVRVTGNMSGLEPEPKDDWLYLGLLALRDIAGKRADIVQSAACIGCGNGIDAIATLRLFPRLRCGDIRLPSVGTGSAR